MIHLERTAGRTGGKRVELLDLAGVTRVHRAASDERFQHVRPACDGRVVRIAGPEITATDEQVALVVEAERRCREYVDQRGSRAQVLRCVRGKRNRCELVPRGIVAKFAAVREKIFYLPILFALFASAGCADIPKLAAEGSGDLSNPPAPRAAPDEALIADCGDGPPSVGAAGMPRRPYIQSVTRNSARILFASQSTSALSVQVTHPDGSLAQTVPAVASSDAQPVNGSPLREARLNDLEPDTTYCYAIEGATGRAGFRTAPDPATNKPVRFVVWGDSGTGSKYQRAVARQMNTVPYDFAVHAGDLAYEKGTRQELQDYFFGMYSGVTRSFDVFPVMGNHDRSTEDGAPLREAFRIPDGHDPHAAGYFYSFDWGPAHLVALDTERIDASQAAWLDDDLERNQLPWVVVIGHRPPYSSGEHGSDLAFRRTFVPILERHHVPLVLSGHEHDYERTHPMNGVTYVVTGGGGRGTRPVSLNPFTAYTEDVLHFVLVELDGPTLLLHAIDAVGREFDSAEIHLG